PAAPQGEKPKGNDAAPPKAPAGTGGEPGSSQSRIDFYPGSGVAWTEPDWQSLSENVRSGESRDRSTQANGGVTLDCSDLLEAFALADKESPTAPATCDQLFQQESIGESKLDHALESALAAMMVIYASK